MKRKLGLVWYILRGRPVIYRVKFQRQLPDIVNPQAMCCGAVVECTFRDPLEAPADADLARAAMAREEYTS